MTYPSDTLFLRRVLGLDALASGATGLLLATTAPWLDRLLGLDPLFARPVGLFLVAYALAVAALALRPRPRPALVVAVIAINALWAVESVLTLVLGWQTPNALGVAFVLAQGAVVAAFAVLQWVAIRPRRRIA